MCIRDRPSNAHSLIHSNLHPHSFRFSAFENLIHLEKLRKGCPATSLFPCSPTCCTLEIHSKVRDSVLTIDFNGTVNPVSYTHLDVYKRQAVHLTKPSKRKPEDLGWTRWRFGEHSQKKRKLGTGRCSVQWTSDHRSPIIPGSP